MAHRRPFHKARSGLARAPPARQSEKDAGGAKLLIPYNGPVQVIRPDSNLPSARTRSRPESGDHHDHWEASHGGLSLPLQHGPRRGLHGSAEKTQRRSGRFQGGRGLGGRGPTVRSWNMRGEDSVFDRASVRDRLELETYQFVEDDYADEERSPWQRDTERPAGDLYRGAGISERDWRLENQQPEDLRHDIERRRNHVGTMHVEGQRGNRRWENPRQRVDVEEEEEEDWNEEHDMPAWDDEPVDDLRHRLVDSQLDSEYHEEPYDESYDESGYQVDLRQMIGTTRRQREFLSLGESFDEAEHDTTLGIRIGDHRDDSYLACHDTSTDDSNVERDWRHAPDSIENQRDSLHQNFAYDEYRHEADWRPRTKELEGGRNSRRHSSAYDDYQGGNQSSERQKDLRYRLARTQRGARYRTEVQTPFPDGVLHTEDPRHHHRPVERDLSNRGRNAWDESRHHDHDSRPHRNSDSRPHHSSDSRPHRSSDSRLHHSSDSRYDFHRASRATEEEGRSRNTRPYRGRDRGEHWSQIRSHFSWERGGRTEQRRDRPHASPSKRRTREVPGTRASETERAPQTPRQNRGDAETDLLQDLDDLEMECMDCSPEQIARVGSDSPADFSQKERSSTASAGPHEDDEKRIVSERAEETTLGSTGGDAIDAEEGADSFDVGKVAVGLSQEPETSNAGSATKVNLPESGTDREGGGERESPDAKAQEVWRISPSDETSLSDAPKTTEIQGSAPWSLMSLEEDGVNTSHREKVPAHIESKGKIPQDHGNINLLDTAEADVNEKVVEGEASHEDMEISGDESDAQVSSVVRSECRAPPDAKVGLSPGDLLPSETQTGAVSRSDTKRHSGAPAPSRRKTPPTSPAALPGVVVDDMQSNQGRPQAGNPQLRAGQHRSPSDCEVEAVARSEVRQTHLGTSVKTAGDRSHKNELSPDVCVRASVALERKSLEVFRDTSECKKPSSHEIRVHSLSPDALNSVRKANGSGETTSESATRAGFSSCASPSAARGHVLAESARNEAPPKCSDSELTDGSDSKGKSRAQFAPASRENSISTSLAQPEANEQLHNNAQPDAGHFQVQLHTKNRAAPVVGPSHAVIRRSSNKESIELSSRESAALRKGSVSATDQNDSSAICGSAQRQVSSAGEEDQKLVGSSCPEDTGREQSATSESSNQHLGCSPSSSPALGGEDKGNDFCNDDSDVDMNQLYTDDEGSENSDVLLDPETVKDWAVGAKATKPVLPLQPRVLSNRVCQKEKAQPKPGKSCIASTTSSKRATTTDTSVGSLNLVCDSPCLEESATTDLSAKLSGLIVVDRNQEDWLNDSLQSANSNNSALTPTDSPPNASAMEKQMVSSGQNNTREGEELARSETNTQHVGGVEDTASQATSRVAPQLNIDDHEDGKLDTGDKPLLAGKVPLKITLMRHSSKEKQSRGHQASFALKPSPEQKIKTLLDVRNQSEACQSLASASASGEHASVSGMMQKLILCSGERMDDSSQRILPESSSVVRACDFTGGSSSETLGIRPPGDRVFTGREAGLRGANILHVGSSSSADGEHQTDGSTSACSKAVSAEARFPGRSVESSSVALESKCTKNSSNADLGKKEGGNAESGVLASSAAGRGGLTDVQTVKPKSSGGLFQELEPSGKPALFPSFKVQLKKKSRYETDHTQEKTQPASADPQTEVTEVAQDGSSDPSANNLDPVPMDIDDDSATSGGIECINEPTTPPIQPFLTASLGFPSSSQQYPNYAVFQQPPFLFTQPPIPFPHEFLSQPPPPLPTFRPWLPAPETPHFQVTGSSKPLYPPLPEEPLPPLPPEPPEPPEPPASSSAQESEGVMQPSLESEGLSESSKTSQQQPVEGQHAEGWGFDNGSSPMAPKSRPIPTLCDHRVKTFRASGSGQDSRGSNLIDLTPNHEKFAEASAKRAADSASYLNKSPISDQQQLKNDASFLQDGNSFSRQYQGNYFYLSSSQNNPVGSNDGRTHGNYGARDEESNQNLSDILPTYPCKTAVLPGTYSGTQSQQQEGMLLGQNKFLPDSAAVDPLEMLPGAGESVGLHSQKLGPFGDVAESQDVGQSSASVKTQQWSRARKSRWSESDNAHVMSDMPSAMESLHTRLPTGFGGVDQAVSLDESDEAPVLAGSVGGQVAVPELDAIESCIESKEKSLEQQESNVMQTDKSFADQASGRGKIRLSFMTSKEESNVIFRERMLPSEGKDPENLEQLSTSEGKESNTLSIDQRLSTDASTGDEREGIGCHESVVKTLPSTEAPGTTAMDLTESSSRDDFALPPSLAPEGHNSLMIEEENLEFGENSPSDFVEEVETCAEGGDESEMQGTFEEESSQTESSFDAWEDKIAHRPSSESCNDPESHKTIPLTSDTTWEGRGEATSESLSEDTFSREPSADRRVESRLDGHSSKTRTSSLTERQHRDKSKAKLRRKSSADKDRDRRPSHSKYRPTSSVSSGVTRSVSWSSDYSLQSYFRHGSSYSSVLKGFKIPKKKNVEGSMDEASSSQQLGRKQSVQRAHHSGGTSRQVDSASGLAAEAGSRLGTQQAGTGFPSQQSPKDSSSSDDELDNLFSTGRRGNQAGPSKVEDAPSPLQPPSKPPRNRIYDSDSESELEDVDFLFRPSSSEQHSSVVKGDDWDQIDYSSPDFQPRSFSSAKLDELVEEKRKEALELQEHLERRRLLKEEIEKGKDRETEDKPQGELELTEHQLKTLDALTMPESVIQDDHPGEKVFHGSQRQSLFTASLSPLDCGFPPGSGALDHYLNPRPDLAKSLIMSDVLILCSQSFSDFNSILNWVFLIMSVHEDALVVGACHRNISGYLEQELQEYQQSGSQPFQSWAPPLHIILRAFLNMGAQLELLLPDQSVLSPDQLREATMRIVDENAVPDAVGRNEESKLPMENLQAVLESLALLLQARPSYSEKELTALFLMMAKLAMDEELIDSYLDYELSTCLENILEKFPKDSFSRTVPALCRSLCQMVEHHHNRVHLCSLLPKSGAACQVRQCFAFMALHQMLNLPEPSQETLEDIQILHWLPLMDHMHELLHNLYSMLSAVLLLECCVSNRAALRPDSGLDRLNSTLQPLRGLIRETGGNLDASKVKNAMVRVGSKWTLLVRACSHPKLFKSIGEMPMMRNELEDSSPERKISDTAEETLLETCPEIEEKRYIDEDMLPDI